MSRHEIPVEKLKLHHMIICAVPMRSRFHFRLQGVHDDIVLNRVSIGGRWSNTSTYRLQSGTVLHHEGKWDGVDVVVASF